MISLERWRPPRSRTFLYCCQSLLPPLSFGCVRCRPPSHKGFGCSERHRYSASVLSGPYHTVRSESEEAEISHARCRISKLKGNADRSRESGICVRTAVRKIWPWNAMRPARVVLAHTYAHDSLTSIDGKVCMYTEIKNQEE